MTDAETKSLRLAADFPAATRQDWLKLVDVVLKGAPFEGLVGSTYDGLSIEPLAARRRNAQAIASRVGAEPWQVMARIDHPDPAAGNEAALDELDSGAGGLSLIFAGAAGSHAFGLPANEDAVARTIEGIDFGEEVAVELDLSPQAEAVVDAALAKGIASLPRGVRVRLGHDPLGAAALAGGGTARGWREAAPHFGRRLAALARDGFIGRLAAADGRVIHDAGGSEAQELAFVLAVALSYLRALESAGVALERARRMIFFRLAADANQFLTIAKFRALRKLWRQVEAACGLEAEPTFVSAETAWRMMARRDPHVNILRTTIAVAAAAFGGADAIGVLPFTAACSLPDRFARRIARNTQLILLAESQLDKVGDPAAGSGSVEDLTDQLGRAAWVLFREIEAAGGAAAALASGLIRDKVAAMCAKRAAAVARRQDALTGVSIFPDLEEAAAAFVPRKVGEGDSTPLSPVRLAEPFEALRDTSDRVLAQTGARPKIFLANLGTPAEFTARTTFAKNFFAVGGIEAAESAGGPALAEVYEKTSGAALACLCSSDEVYASEAAAAARTLKAAGARHIYLAGRPRDQEAALQASGVQSFIFEGCDALATLRSAYNILGIAIG